MVLNTDGDIHSYMKWRSVYEREKNYLQQGRKNEIWQTSYIIQFMENTVISTTKLEKHYMALN